MNNRFEPNAFERWYFENRETWLGVFVFCLTIPYWVILAVFDLARELNG